MASWGEVRSITELVILVFLAIKALGGMLQKHEDSREAHAWRLDGHEKWIQELDDRVQSLREIRVADRLSRLESAVPALEARMREEFVTRAVWDEHREQSRTR